MAGQQNAFRALADPTRRQILLYLSANDMTIGEVADHFDITRAAVKKHLLILEEGDLISVQSRGREKVNRLQPTGLKSVAEWVNYFGRFWDQHLGKMQTAIESENGKSDDK